MTYRKLDTKKATEYVPMGQWGQLHTRVVDLKTRKEGEIISENYDDPDNPFHVIKLDDGTEIQRKPDEVKQASKKTAQEEYRDYDKMKAVLDKLEAQGVNASIEKDEDNMIYIVVIPSGGDEYNIYFDEAYGIDKNGREILGEGLTLDQVVSKAIEIKGPRASSKTYRVLNTKKTAQEVKDFGVFIYEKDTDKLVDSLYYDTREEAIAGAKEEWENTPIFDQTIYYIEVWEKDSEGLFGNTGKPELHIEASKKTAVMVGDKFNIGGHNIEIKNIYTLDQFGDTMLKLQYDDGHEVNVPYDSFLSQIKKQQEQQVITQSKKKTYRKLDTKKTAGDIWLTHPDGGYTKVDETGQAELYVEEAEVDGERALVKSRSTGISDSTQEQTVQGFLNAGWTKTEKPGNILEIASKKTADFKRWLWSNEKMTLDDFDQISKERQRKLDDRYRIYVETQGQTEEGKFLKDESSKKTYRKLNTKKTASIPVEKITFDKLKEMKPDDGFVLLGAGGNLDEWIDGVTGVLNEEEIVKGTAEEIFDKAYLLTTTGGRTDLVLTFKDAGWDLGKLAIWRLKFGDCSWISDYLVNYADQHNSELTPTESSKKTSEKKNKTYRKLDTKKTAVERDTEQVESLAQTIKNRLERYGRPITQDSIWIIIHEEMKDEEISSSDVGKIEDILLKEESKKTYRKLDTK
jgi:hypothetical protein